MNPQAHVYLIYITYQVDIYISFCKWLLGITIQLLVMLYNKSNKGAYITGPSVGWALHLPLPAKVFLEKPQQTCLVLLWAASLQSCLGVGEY